MPGHGSRAKFLSNYGLALGAGGYEICFVSLQGAEEMDLVTFGELKFRMSRRFIRTLTMMDSVLDDIGDPQGILNYLRKNNIRADLLTFSQVLTEPEPKFNYHMEMDSIAALPITTYDNWLMKQIHPNTRNKIRKAHRAGVRVEVEKLSRKLAEGLAGIFNETRIRRGRPYEYYGIDVETVLKEWAPNSHRSNFLVAYFEREVIGFIQLVYGETVARTSGTVAKISHRNKAPMNALFAKAVEICSERRINFLVYGKYIYGKKGADSLTTFKRNCGFHEVRIPRYYLPLSFKGMLCLNFHLHKGISEILPGFLQRRMLKLRTLMFEAGLLSR